MVRITPPFGVTGLWTLKAPYQVKPAKVYTCTAIRSFVELELINIDIYRNYYLPVKLSEADYLRDLRAGASLVVLLGTDGERYHVPDTYIQSYPDLGIGNYKRFILSCDLGTLPHDAGFSHITDELKATIESKLGRAVNVNVYSGPLTPDRLTPIELKREEQVRKTAVTNRTTSHGKLYQTSLRLGELEGYVNVLQKQLAVKDQFEAKYNDTLKQNEVIVEQNKQLTKDNKKLIAEVKQLEQTEQMKNQRIALLERTILELGGRVPE